MSEEEQLVSTFFLKEKRDRYLQFIKNPKQRKKFISELAHSKALDERLKHVIPGFEQTAKGITGLLKASGAFETCLAISDYKEIDGRRMPLADALNTVLGRTAGTFLSCRPGMLAYFENEDGRWILKR